MGCWLLCFCCCRSWTGLCGCGCGCGFKNWSCIRWFYVGKSSCLDSFISCADDLSPFCDRPAWDFAEDVELWSLKKWKKVWTLRKGASLFHLGDDYNHVENKGMWFCYPIWGTRSFLAKGQKDSFDHSPDDILKWWFLRIIMVTTCLIFPPQLRGYSVIASPRWVEQVKVIVALWTEFIENIDRWSDYFYIEDRFFLAIQSTSIKILEEL